jgi:integrase
MVDIQGFYRHLLNDRLVSKQCAKWHVSHVEKLVETYKEITSETLTQYRYDLQEKGCSEALLNKVRQTFSLYAQFAKIDLVLWKHFKEHPKKKANLSIEEIHTFIAKDPPPSKYGMYWKLYCFSGARPGAVRTLTLEQIDFDNHVLYVSDKTKETRPVIIEDIVYPDLVSYCKTLNTRHLFPCPTSDTPLSRKSIENDFTKRIHSMGLLKHVSVYSIRHSFGRRMAPKVGIEQLKELMGHESVVSTMQYLERNEYLMKEASKKDPAQEHLRSDADILIELIETAKEAIVGHAHIGFSFTDHSLHVELK